MALISGVASCVLATLAIQAEGAVTPPIIGDLSSNWVRVWVRSEVHGRVRISLIREDGDTSRHCSLWTRWDSDNTGFVQIGLKPDTRYAYSVNGETNDDWWFRTRPVLDETCRIAFGSCADEGEGSSSVWRRIDADEATAIVLLGDTPYIDTTDLETQRARYRAFASVPAFASLVSHTPLYSTWDDHDFGKNDTDGNLPGKENSRQAFREYRPNPSFGENEQGIYTSFRQGPVEVFLLDARWFAGTEETRTLLGAQQWAWLERSLRDATAPYKVLACGMVFNGSVRPGKTDCWGRYPNEYQKLLDTIIRAGATGVVLVSGDVHWSRVIRHDTKARIGYDLVEWTTSPVHERLIAIANMPHPGLRFSKGVPNTFLLIEGSGKQLTLSLRTADGETVYQQLLSEPPGTIPLP